MIIVFFNLCYRYHTAEQRLKKIEMVGRLCLRFVPFEKRFCLLNFKSGLAIAVIQALLYPAVNKISL